MKKFFLYLSYFIFIYNTFGFEVQNYNWRNVKIEGGGGFVPGVVFNPTQPGLVYARTDIGGVYRSTDSGKTWVQLLNWVSFDEWNLLGCESVATDPVEPNRLYIAAGTYTNSWTNMNGEILISEDYGETFTRVPLPFKLGGNMPARNMGERLVIDPNKNSILYLGTREGNGLWRSTDYGRTWNKVENFPNPGTWIEDPNCPYDYLNHIPGVVWIVFDPASSNFGEPTKTIYVGVADLTNNLFVSNDAGTTWQPVQGAPTGLMPHRAKLSSDGWLYITYTNKQGPYNPDKGRVYKYNTKTGQWIEISPMNYNDCYFGYGGIAIDPLDPKTIMVTALSSWWPDTFIWRSTDGGITWRCIWEWAGYPSRTLHYTMDITEAPWLDFGNKNPQPPEVSPKLGWMVAFLEIDPHNRDNMLYGTGATIYGSENLTDWDRGGKVNIKVRAIGIEETAVLALVSHPDGALYSCLGDLSGFRHDDITKAPTYMYRTPNFASSTDLDFAENMKNFVVRVGNVDRTWNPNVNRIGFSYDYGDNWFQASSEPPGVTGGGKVAVSADGSVVIWSPEGASGVYYTTNNGSSWSQCGGLEGGGYIVRSDRKNPNKFYAFKNGNFYISTNKGQTFVLTYSGLPNSGNFKVTYTHEGHIWFVSDEEQGGMWRSTDSGQTFTKLSNVQKAASVGFGKPKEGSSYPSIYTYALIENVRAIFRSDDEGASWIRINDDKNQFGCANADITGDRNVYGRVYLATNGLGIKVGDIAGAQQQPTGFTISININPSGAGYVTKNPNKTLYTPGESVTLQAHSRAGYVFSGWSGDVTDTQNPLVVTVNSNLQITANFSVASSTSGVGTSSYTLTVIIEPQNSGTVSLNPPGGIYVAGSTVTLTAVSNSGYKFSHWSGDISSTNSLVSILMNSNKTVKAHFAVVSSTDSSPTIISINLTNNQTISGVYNLVVECEDDAGISEVQIYIDGNLYFTDFEPPYSFSLNTTQLPNGSHSLLVVVYDTLNQSASHTITFIVENPTQQNIQTEIKDRYLLTPNNDGKNEEIDFGVEVEWVKVYDTKGNLVYETKSKIDKKSNLKTGNYIYKIKFKSGKVKNGSISVIK
ncbi:MAG: Ig-like domain-containing protein [Candidatus Kryptonium sp.]